MTIIICPGVHSPQITSNFIQSTKTSWQSREHLVLPTTQFTPYSAIAIEQWLKQHYSSPRQTQPLSFIAFSAGVVGAIGAALAWQLQGGKIQHFIAMDGWGMPLIGNFPCYRISHDYFTHWSSSILGAGKVNFYADPEVEHLDLWRSPETCWGWQVDSLGFKSRDSLTNFIDNILNS
jgi:hypothetical protein